MRYLTNLDLVQNQLLNAVIQVLATDPANGTEGQIYYNSTNKVLRQYIGNAWVNVGVLYNQESKTGAVVTGLNNQGDVETTNVIGLTLEGYTPVEDGYVTANMTLEEAYKAIDTALKNIVAEGGEPNQNAWSSITVAQQSTGESAVAGAGTGGATITATTKTDKFTIATGNKWVDVGANADDKQINIGHSLSGATAGDYGAANKVANVSVDAAGHITKAEEVEITAAAIGAATAQSVTDLAGQESDATTLTTVWAAKNAAKEAKEAADAAQTAADGKVASVGATANKGIEIAGTATAPTVGIKLDPAAGNAATLGADGLLVTVPAAAEYSIVKDADSGDYAAIYHLTKGGTNVGAAINIPKDLFVKEGKIVDNPAGQPEGKYIELTLQNQTDPIYINVADLVDAYTAGNGITISASNEVSAKVVAANGLSVDADGIKMGLASADAAGAMSTAQFTKLAGIDEGATANTITLNGAATKTPAFYAPVGGGTAGQVLVAGGDGVAPTWQAMPEHYHKYTATNAALTAAGGAYTWTIEAATHGISNPAMMVQLYEVASGEQVMADFTVNQATYAVTIKINETVAASPLAANTYKVVLFG